MKKGHGLRKYFYEYLFYKTVTEARSQTGQVLEVSHAKRIRRRIDERLGRLHASAVADPQLGVTPYLDTLDAVMTEEVAGYQPQFGDHTTADARYAQLQTEFMRSTGLGSTNVVRRPGLPISPYDPQWSERFTLKQSGTALAWIDDAAIEAVADGETQRLHHPAFADLSLYRDLNSDRPVEVGPAMTDDDAAGLTALMDMMSAKEYREVRDWVIDGARDPRTKVVNRDGFSRPEAVQRSVAVLADLQRQGIGYEITRDRNPGQIKARITDTGLDIRLLDTRENDRFTGARLYDKGMPIYYSTTHHPKLPNGKRSSQTLGYSPSPEEAVELLRFAQGHRIQRRDGSGPVGGEGEYQSFRYGKPVTIPNSYYVGRSSTFVVDDLVLNGKVVPGAKVTIRRDASERGQSGRFFTQPEVAQEYLEEAVASARQNLEAKLDIDALVDHYQHELAQATAGRLTLLEEIFADQSVRPDQSVADQLEPPEFSSDPEVAGIQRMYWDHLAGYKPMLMRPGVTSEMVADRLDQAGDMRLGAQGQFGDLEETFDGLLYQPSASPADRVRDHASETVDLLIGTAESQAVVTDDGELVDRRFDPIRVAKYMTSSDGLWGNLDTLASALRRCEVDPEEMMGEGFQSTRFKDRLVRFDSDSAASIVGPDSQIADPFLRKVGATVVEAIARNGARPGEVEIDHQGVIRWNADKLKRDGTTTPVSGQIGQVFSPGEHGEIVTRFVSGDNSLIVPGYEARVRPNSPGERASVEERTLLRGYEQILTERIAVQVADDLLSGRTEVGEGASLNTVYAQLYGTKHPVDYLEQHMVEPPMDPATGQRRMVAGGPELGDLDPWAVATLDTEARRVRYPNVLKEGSTVYAEHHAARERLDPADDNHFDAWRLTAGRNMAVLTGTDQHGVVAPEGYFDPIMTGGSTNQGVIRFLTAGAVVEADGSITPGDVATLEGTRAPLMCREELQSMRFDPFDRQQMTTSTLMQASKVTPPTGTALMTFGGWGADDGIVVSKRFAQTHRIHGLGGEQRDLVPGDKLSDLHGNKGVISLIVDPEMSIEEARDQDLEEEVRWFRQNPELDVVMSPFSLISRRNAGAARELMSSDVTDLEHSDAESRHRPFASSMGQMRFVVTHMAVDEKTKVYDDEALLSGMGRKASSQLAWALQSQGCSEIMKEFYGTNIGAEANLREMLLSVGLDMEAAGWLKVVNDPAAQTPQDGDPSDEPSLEEVRPERRLFEMPPLQRTVTGSLNTSAMRTRFGELIGDKGGDLELPFSLSYPTGRQTEQIGDGRWKVPVMSSHLRSGQEFEDGTSVTHDYTSRYLDIHEQACVYRHRTEMLADPELSEQQREKYAEDLALAQQKAQRAFEFINAELEHRVFSGKRNVFRSGLMSSRLPDSATAVWTADPRLDIDQVGMGPAMAKALGLEDDDYVLIWRDPVLRDAGVRYLRVAIDDRLTGVSINPVMDKCFDGDFDGDAVAVVKLHSQAARREAMERLSVPVNLLDRGSVDEQGLHPLAMQLSLDTQVGIKDHPDSGQRFEALLKDANAMTSLLDTINDELGEIDREERVLSAHGSTPEIETRRAELLMAESKQLEERTRTGESLGYITNQLSDCYRYTQRRQFGAALSFGPRTGMSATQSHVESVRSVCIDTGAKGSLSKLDEYVKNLGCGVGGYDDTGEPGITRADQEASMYSTAVKSFGTGLAGSFSQRAVRALRNEELKAVLELTYPVTQSILQAKHDAAEARHKYEMLLGPGRDLWRGRLLERQGACQWKTVLDEDTRQPVQAGAEEWKRQFLDFYQSSDGFNVKINPACVDKVAAALTDSSGIIRDLEEDPVLQGSLMDRLAYGGELKDLIKAAEDEQNLFSGRLNQEFCSNATRRQLSLATGSALGLEDFAGLPGLVPTVEPELVKHDVVADHEESAKPRGSTRRSAHVTAVSSRSGRRPAAVPAYASQEPWEVSAAEAGDEGMGL